MIVVPNLDIGDLVILTIIEDPRPLYKYDSFINRFKDKIGLVVRMPLEDSNLKIYKILVENEIHGFFGKDLTKLEIKNDQEEKTKKEEKG